MGGSRASPFLLKSDPNLWRDKGDTHGPRTCLTFPFNQFSEKVGALSVTVSDIRVTFAKLADFYFGLYNSLHKGRRKVIEQAFMHLNVKGPVKASLCPTVKGRSHKIMYLQVI